MSNQEEVEVRTKAGRKAQRSMEEAADYVLVNREGHLEECCTQLCDILDAVARGGLRPERRGSEEAF